MSEETADGGASLASVAGDDERAVSEAVTAAHPVHPYVHVVVVAVIGAVAVLAWLVVFEEVTRLLWENDFVTANP